MTAKNTAVNIIILTTFLSFLFYRRSGKTPTAELEKNWQHWYLRCLLPRDRLHRGYRHRWVYRPTDLRVNILTPYQVLVALAVMAIVTIVDIFMYRKATTSGTIKWGEMTDRSQYVLILVAITFTSLMGLMGYARSGLRRGVAYLRCDARYISRCVYAASQ